MRRFARLLATIAVATVTAVGYPAFLPEPGPVVQASPPDDGMTHIMPLGDSITGSTGCWRETLWNDLRDAGYTDLDFVGHHTGPSCDGASFDDDSNGISGAQISELAANGTLFKWLKEDYPDVILMHYGSNDIRRGKTTDQIIDGMTIAVDQMRQVNPDVIILVAQLIPMTPTPMYKSCPQCPQGVDELNAAIPGWAEEHTTDDSPITVVDQNTGFDADTDTYDGLHSDGSGGEKLAANWFAALAKVLLTRGFRHTSRPCDVRPACSLPVWQIS